MKHYSPPPSFSSEPICLHPNSGRFDLSLFDNGLHSRIFGHLIFVFRRRNVARSVLCLFTEGGRYRTANTLKPQGELRAFNNQARSYCHHVGGRNNKFNNTIFPTGDSLESWSWDLIFPDSPFDLDVGEKYTRDDHAGSATFPPFLAKALILLDADRCLVPEIIPNGEAWSAKDTSGAVSVMIQSMTCWFGIHSQ